MKKIILAVFLSLVCAFTLSVQGQQTRRYESVANDPYGARIYTLKNGLKVYMSVYKDVPRIQTFIAVRIGSKNDPAETTGLAHYLEHLMFKGTSKIGTLDWEKEEPLLNQIEALFEVYRAETDETRRAEIYHRIDSLSYLASGYAIPNEYVKLMKLIGSTGTNAWTSNDNTVFTEDIPSNQLENWARIQSERFTDPVIRLFHTELETVYEEKNRSLANDSRRANEALLAALFPKHPYGQQTTLGEAEHLKNPSITNIREFIRKHYVPGNMAICLAGDFDPAEAIDIIEKYFGNMEAKDDVERQQLADFKWEKTSGVSVEVDGQEAAFVTIAFPLNLPANHELQPVLKMLDQVLSNGKSGLIDLNINQKQLTASASSYPYVLCDNSALMLTGKPRQGQSLEDVKDLLLKQLDLLRKGDFDKELLTAAINNIRLKEMNQLESNSGRANKLLSSFIDGIPWETACHEARRYENITIDDIVKFANDFCDPSQAVVVYKRQNKPQEVKSVPKPAITPIQINRDAESSFYSEIKNQKVNEIEPVFVDFGTQFERKKSGNLEVMCVKNTENETFQLSIALPAGEMALRTLPIAASYLNYLGTDQLSAEKVHSEFFKMACTFRMTCSDEKSYLILKGLSENFNQAFALMMQLVRHPKADEEAFRQLIENRIKAMEDAKHVQDKVLAALRIYVEYGKKLVNYSLKPNELEKLSAEDVLKEMSSILDCQPEIVYYGPLSAKELCGTFKKYYGAPKTFAEAPVHAQFEKQEVTRNEVYYVPYTAKQARLVTYSRGPLFSKELLPISTMYNSYFGGGMNAIVFQEMREKRSLAYTAQSSFILPSEADDYAYNYSFIGTQNDKVTDAWTAFDELFNEMPMSEAAFELAKEAALANIATTRITKMKILSTYLNNKKRGYDYDSRRDIYGQINSFTLDDVVKFNEQYIREKPKKYMLLAKEGEVDLKKVEELFGPVTRLKLEDIFGY